jgi:hypothetical protein
VSAVSQNSQRVNQSQPLRLTVKAVSARLIRPVPQNLRRPGLVRLVQRNQHLVRLVRHNRRPADSARRLAVECRYRRLNPK